MNKFKVGDIVRETDTGLLWEVVGKTEFWRYWKFSIGLRNIAVKPVDRVTNFPVYQGAIEEYELATDYMAQLKFQKDLEELLNE